jgi:hypothetical protein
MFCRLFLFPAKDICYRINVKGQNNNSGDSVAYSVDMFRWWQTVLLKCWYMAQGVKQITREVTLRFFQEVTFTKYVTAAKQTRLPEIACSNGCCGRCQVSFPNQSAI